ncbi:MAG: TolC family protein [Lentisphaerae bacterium]|nr:TolC family protein [Lentisphaerota bacterium]
MYRVIPAGIVCCAVLGSLAVAAEETIDDLVAAALAAQPEWRALQADGDAARAGLVQADLRPNPEFRSEFGLKRADADGHAESGYAFGVGLEQTFERRGKRAARSAIASADMAIADAARARFAIELEARVRGLAHQYAIATADAQAADEVSRRSQALIEMLRQRPAAGAPVFLELRLVEASLIEFQSALRERTALRDDSRLALNTLLGRPLDSPITIPRHIGPPTRPIKAEALAEGIPDGPRMRARQAELARIAGERQAAVLDAKPDVSAGPYFAREDAGDSESVLGLALSMELPWRNRNQGTVAAAGAREVRALAMMEAEERAIQSELARALAAYERAREALDWVSSQRVEQTHAAADLAERQYRLGAIGVQLFLDLQRESLNVQRLRYDALLRAWQSALDIYLLTGVKPEVES